MAETTTHLQPPLPSHTFSLYAGDLHPEVTEHDLYNLFSVISPSHTVHLCRNQVTHHSLCYAYINFFFPFHAATALRQLNHTVLKGKPIRIMWVQTDAFLRKTGIGNLFVKNLAVDIDVGKLKDVFGVFGRIISCKIAKNEDGKSKGFGYVQFDSKESAAEALRALDGSVLDGKILTVAKYLNKSERKERQFTNVFVKNLDLDFTESSLLEKFSEYGKVTSAVIVNDAEGKSRGFGFVNFESHENAKKAIEALNDAEIDAFDNEKLLSTVEMLRNGKAVDIPKYDFRSYKNNVSRRVNPSDVIILEGILIFHDPRIRDLMNMKIFVDTDADVRLARRIRRDTGEKGRDIGMVLDQYSKFVKPAFDDFILPTKKYADIIIPRGGDNHVAIDLIVQHIRTKLGQHDLCKIYPNLYVIHSTFQIRGMHTLIRDAQTTKHDFVFYADRLIRLVVEHGLGHLPFTEKQVVTPTGSVYTGVDFCKRLCGVSVIRSGESMENALRACCKGIKIGKILIHREGDNGQQLIYEKLPQDISDRHVLLLDPILGTGNSAVQAIRLLLKKGVPEANIIFLNLISAPQGVHAVCKHFPRIKIVTSEIETGLNEEYRVLPGMGEFGDRYFGTDDE